MCGRHDDSRIENTAHKFIWFIALHFSVSCSAQTSEVAHSQAPLPNLVAEMEEATESRKTWQTDKSNEAMARWPVTPWSQTHWPSDTKIVRYTDSARMKPRWRRIRRFRTMPFASLYYWTSILDDLEVANFQGCLNQVKVSVKLLEMLLLFFSFLLCVWSSGRCLVWLRWISVDSWYPGWRGGCKDCRVPLRSLMHSPHTQTVKKFTYLTCRKVGSSPQICYHRQAKCQSNSSDSVVTQKELHRSSKNEKERFSFLDDLCNSFCVATLSLLLLWHFAWRW